MVDEHIAVLWLQGLGMPRRGMIVQPVDRQLVSFRNDPHGRLHIGVDADTAVDVLSRQPQPPSCQQRPTHDDHRRLWSARAEQLGDLANQETDTFAGEHARWIHARVSARSRQMVDAGISTPRRTN